MVYLAFTRALLLRQWLCDFATVAPRPGGRMYLWWNGDFFSAGEYLELEENKTIKFKWHARIDPEATTVVITLAPKADGTDVNLQHIVPDGDEWKARATGFKAEWDSTLPNLASLLETGLDRRIYDRPMLGIQINDFNAAIAQSMKIPVSEGIRLAEAAEGMGARAAGLTQDDVIVEFNGKSITSDIGSLTLALQGKKGGDQVKVVYYRGPEKVEALMTLSKRQVPDIPSDPKELADLARVKYDQVLSALDSAFAAVSEAEGDHNPAEGEWSAKQTLAHLIHTERNWLSNMDDLLTGYERNADDFGGNNPIHIRAIIISLGTIPELLNELKLLSTEVIAFLANIPPEFVAWKCNYINLGNTMLNGMFAHTLSHLEQIKQAVQAARRT
jgi:uncharacterized protein YndB with AHSA1/START domain